MNKKEIEKIWKSYNKLTPRNKRIFKLSLASTIANQKLEKHLENRQR